MPHASHLPDLTGQQVDQYRLLRRLGSGGGGVVYLAESIVNKAQVAIKIVYMPLDTQNIAAFIAEAQSILLEHPHIVRIKKFGQFQQYPFFVMAYLSRGNLRQRHPLGTKLSWAVILPYIRQITDALQYIHEQGTVHRDIKPENMLIDEHNNILLADFGIAVTSYTINAKMQNPSGTIPYMAPEQFNGMAGRATDQYALGAVIYEWLTGRPPFIGKPENIIDQHLQTPAASLRRLNSSIDPLIDALVLKTLAKRPEDRFTSMREFLAEVERITIAMTTTTRVKTIVSDFTEHAYAVQTIAWSPNDKYIASAGHDKVVHVWDTTTGQIIHSYHGHTEAIWSLAWSPDSRSLISAGADEVVQIWEATTGYPLSSYTEHQGTIRSVAWSPNGLQIASTGDDKTVNVWDLKADQLVYSYHEHNQSIYCLAWSPDGSHLASGDNEAIVRIWEATTGKYFRVYRKHTERVTSIAWSPDGKYIATASSDGIIHIWENHSGKLLNMCTGHEDAVSSVAWSPNGKYLASGSWDQTVRLWEWNAAHKAKCLYTYKGHKQWVTTVAWSPDSKYIASGSWDKTVHIFSLVTIL